jgi:hypothetical protein
MSPGEPPPWRRSQGLRRRWRWVWPRRLLESAPPVDTSCGRGNESERRREDAKVPRADPTQLHQRSRRAEPLSKRRDRWRAALESLREQPDRRCKERMDPRETAPHPPDGRRERDGLFLLGRTSALRGLLDAPGRLRGRDGVFDRFEQPGDPGSVEIRQQADRHAAPAAVEPRDLCWPWELPRVRPVRRYRPLARRARRQSCRPPRLTRNVLLEGERPFLAQLHLSRPAAGATVAGLLLPRPPTSIPSTRAGKFLTTSPGLRARRPQDRRPSRVGRSSSRITNDRGGQHQSS